MNSNSEKTTLQRLMELKDLYESGIITMEEMEARKRQILEIDDSPVDNPNGEIENELDGEIPNQAEDDSRNDNLCSPAPNVENEEQLRSNIEQGNEESNSLDSKPTIGERKKSKLFLVVTAIVVVIVALAFILTPTDYNKKVAKAIERYQAESCNVLSTSGIGESSEENHYVIYEKDGAIFYDGLDRKVPVKAIMPREEGFIFKQVIPRFIDGKPTITYKLLNDGKKSNIKLGNNVSSGAITRIKEAKKNVLNGDKSICIVERIATEVYTSYYYSLSNPDTVYVFRGDMMHNQGKSYCKQDYSFLDVVGGEEDDTWSPFSFQDYRFTMRIEFPNSDPKSLHFDNCIYIVNEADYPMDMIFDRLQYTKKEGEQPIVWYSKKNLDVVVDCLEQDMSRKYYERISKQRVEERMQNTFTLEQLCDIFYESSKKFNGESFKERFPTGKELYLATRAESIKYSSESGYTYVIKATKGLGLEVEANIYTNDESFVNLNYPAMIYAKVAFDRTYTEKESFFTPTIRIFDFYDAELILWESE